MSLHGLVVGFFRALASRAIRHPKATVLLATAVTLAVAPGVFRLKLRTDGHALVAEDAPEVLFDKAVRDRFGLEDLIVVLVRSDHPDGIFNPATLQRVRALTAALATLPGLRATNVVSLATEPSFRVRPGTLMRQALLEPPLQTKPELDQLREDLRQLEIYTGTLVAYDGRSTAILVGAPSGDRTELYQRILEVLAAQGPIPEDLLVTGAPVAEALLGIHILEDLGVPQGLLGTSTRSHAEQVAWKLPASLFELRQMIARRIGLVPVAVLVMLLVFYASFRRALTALLPLPEVAASLLFVFGLMGWTGVPIYLTIAVMPVLLTAMGVTDEIHVFSRYFARLRERPGVPHIELVQETMDEMCCPVANTTLTTAIGFVSFAFSPLGPVQAFGLFTAVGVLFCLFWSLTVIPAMLVLIHPDRLVRRRRGRPAAGSGRASAGFGRLARTVVRYRYGVLGWIVLLTALTPLGLRRLVVQDSWIDGFDPASEFRRATRLVNEQFHGMHVLLVCLDATKILQGEIPPSAVSVARVVLPGDLVDDPAALQGSRLTLSADATPASSGRTNARSRLTWRSHAEMTAREGQQLVIRTPLKDAPPSFWQELATAPTIRFEIDAQAHLEPAMIRTAAELASFIRERRQYAVGGVLGPGDYLATTRFMVRPADPKARVLPDTAGETKMLWDYYRIARGRERLRQVVTTNYAQSITTVFLKEANFISTARLMDDLRAYEREHLAPQGVQLGFAGDVAVSQSLITGIVATQLRSLGWSLLGIYAVTALLGRSLRWGVYCVLPSTLAVVINFAVMGWFGIPLGVATSMFAGMTLGLGVDFAIHVLEGYGLARADGLSQPDAMSRAMSLTGLPVLVNTVAISLGFGVLMLSQVPANARLGVLVVLGMVDCLIASLLLLPVLLHWWPLKDPRAPQKAPAPSTPPAGLKPDP